MSTHDVFTIELRRLTDSPSQPRTEYHGLAELAESIRKHGVMQPILCRPITARQIGAPAEADLEIVYGHRRARAAELAELDEIPAIIRPMSDLQVLQAQVVENLQREDVSPLDEGRAYTALRDQHGQTPKQIADALGVSVRHVTARMQLLCLTGKARLALTEGMIGSDIALLICAVSPLLHDQALLQVTRTLENGEVLALPVRAARSNLRGSKLLHNIMDAPFDPLLPALIDNAGPCLQCPSSTTNMGDGAMEQLGADVCVDRMCYLAKVRAHTQRELGNLADNGWTILDAEPEFGTWKKLEGECIDSIAKAIAIDPTQRVHCIAWPDAVTGLHAQGVTAKGYTAILRLIFPAPAIPATPPSKKGEGGDEEGENVAMKRDMSDREPRGWGHDGEGAEWAREKLRTQIMRAVLSGSGWPPGRADLILVCAALAINVSDEARALTGLPRHSDGPGKTLDEIARWPENRIAMTVTALAISTMADELSADRCVFLLSQLHARYLDGDGDRDQTSLAAGEEVTDKTPLTGRDQTDDAGASARQTATAEARYEAGLFASQTQPARQSRKAPAARYRCPASG